VSASPAVLTEGGPLPTTITKSAELHLYSKGGHGFGMKKQNLPTDHWIERFADWLELQGLLKK